MASSVKHPSTWIPPANGRVKLNFDAALPREKNELRIGVVARDADGSCLGFRIVCKRGNFNPVDGEAMAAMEAISWAQRKGWRSVEVEGDCLQVIKALKDGGSELASFGMVIEDCKKLAMNFHFVSFSFIKRSGNMLAHALAKFSCNKELEGSLLPPNLANMA